MRKAEWGLGVGGVGGSGAGFPGGVLRAGLRGSLALLSLVLCLCGPGLFRIYPTANVSVSQECIKMLDSLLHLLQ